MNLQTAREEIGDLNLQVTILTSGKMQMKILRLLIVYYDILFQTVLYLFKLVFYL